MTVERRCAEASVGSVGSVDAGAGVSLSGGALVPSMGEECCVRQSWQNATFAAYSCPKCRKVNNPNMRYDKTREFFKA